MPMPLLRILPVALAVVGSIATANAQTTQPATSILFVGNSYTFGRTDPVLTYNAANVRDLTKPQGPTLIAIDGPSPTGTPKFTNIFGTNSYPVDPVTGVAMTNPATFSPGNSYSPHTQTNGWGGVAGIFKQFTVQAGLNYDVALSTRNAATLRGHLLNTANPNWDMRGNIASQTWDKMILQEQSDEALAQKTVNGIALGSNLPSIRANVDLIEDWVHTGKVTIGTGLNQTAVTSYSERAMYAAQYGTRAACEAAGGGSFCNNGTTRNLGQNAFASLNTQIYLQETWARPNLINSPGTPTINPATGNATYDTTKPVPSYFGSLEEMTIEMTAGMKTVADFASEDGTSGITGIIPTGRSFLEAVKQGVATRNMYAGDALTDGLIDLWFNDGTHASTYGSYLSALTTFASVTGIDPRTLGRNEIAAMELGISGNDAVALQRIAAATMVPEPETYAMMLAGLGLLGFMSRRRKLSS